MKAKPTTLLDFATKIVQGYKNFFKLPLSVIDSSLPCFIIFLLKSAKAIKANSVNEEITEKILGNEAMKL